MNPRLNCHVLIVDDSPILRAAIKKVVKLAGVSEQFAIQLRQRSDVQDVVVVVVSTEANRERLERMRALGVERTLRKPFEPEDLCRLIADVLGIKSSNSAST